MTNAIRIEKYGADADFAAALLSRLLARFPAGRLVRQNSTTWLFHLRSPWRPDDEQFLGQLATQEQLINSWEPITIGEIKRRLPKGTTYEAMGERLSHGKALTHQQQLALWQERQDMEAKISLLEAENNGIRNKLEMSEESLYHLTEEYNWLAHFFETQLRINIFSRGTDQENRPLWTVQDKETGRILLRSSDLAEIYTSAFHLRGVDLPLEIQSSSE
jgi:hypothetical protein